MKLNKGERMFKALKIKFAARRVERKKNSRRSNSHSKASFWTRMWNVCCAPFRAIGRACRRVWLWISGLNLIGLVNTTLLSAIIVLFSMLIIDVVKSNKTPLVIVAKNDISAPVRPQITVSNQSAPRNIRNRENTLPLRRDAQRQFIGEPINVARVQPDRVAIKQTARRGKTMYGDVIIDSRGAATMLKTGDVIKGNLYLQHMRKYTLPRGIRVEGNMFLRDMGMLQFGGEFTVTGNIYVTPTSSFGPIPGTARLGGQVII